jgi:MarR-like DNA-binding transcriptional regulator SgrR of sgrS sRNA
VGFSIICKQRKRPLQNWKAALHVFKEQNESKSFTSHDLANVLGLSSRACLQILKKALDSKKVEKIGRGKNSRYIFYSGRRAA